MPAAALAEASLVDGLEIHGAATLTEVLRWLSGELSLRRPGPRPMPVADGRRLISLMSSGRTMRGRPARSLRRAGTTCCSSGRRARARRCWPSASSGCCPSSTRGSVGARLDPVGGRAAARYRRAHHRAAADRAAPLHVHGGVDRRGQRPAAPRGGLAGPPGRAVPRRGPRGAPHLLDALRTPLEDGTVRLSRTEGTVEYPARFQLVLAANPCPCAPRTTAIACVRRWCGRRYLGGCPGRCSIGWTAGADAADHQLGRSVAEPRGETAQVRVGCRGAGGGRGAVGRAGRRQRRVRARFSARAFPGRLRASSGRGLARARARSLRAAPTGLRVAWTLAIVWPVNPRTARARGNGTAKAAA